MNNRHRILRLIAALGLIGFLAAAALADSQSFPTKAGSKGLSEFLIKPSQGLDKPPAGWKLATGHHYGISSLANEYLTPENKKALPVATTSYALPKANYTVSVLVRGTGKARLKGAEKWTEINTPSPYSFIWVEIGAVKDATMVTVEVAPVEAGSPLFYGGFLAEGSRVEVLPVAKVLEKLRKGEPTTIVLLGDSVTENWGGTGGGSSKFEKGNAGLFLGFLKEKSGNEVDYLTHRSPPDWPTDRKKDADKIKRVTIDGTEYFDSRIETDASKKIHLINLGVGGTDAKDGWRQISELVYDDDYIDKDKKTESVRYGMAHYKPDLVIVNFGTNDVNSVHAKWTPEDYLFHMKVLATGIQQRLGAAVILSTPHKWNRGTMLFPNRQPALVDILRDYCAKSGFALADAYNEYAPGEVDEIHPRDVGHKHLADAYIKALLGEPSKPAIVARTHADQLKDNGDGTVTDTKTGLMWTRDGNLAGSMKDATEAGAFIEGLNKERKFGHDDWRLASRDELLALVDPSQRQPAMSKGVPFTNVMSNYLTASSGWYVDLSNGIEAAPGSSAKEPRVGYVWPVRGVVGSEEKKQSTHE